MTHGSDFAYAVLLILAISFVYAASRTEPMKDVLVNGLKLSGWFMGVLFVIFLIMCVIF